MFLFWLFIFILCCVGENIGDRIDAYKYEKRGGFYADYPCFKPKDNNKK